MPLLKCTGYGYSDRCQLSCTPGFVMMSSDGVPMQSFERVCSDKGEWSRFTVVAGRNVRADTFVPNCFPLECGLPPNFSNGQIDCSAASPTINDHCNFTCDEGYRPNPPTFQTTCLQTGLWSQTPPVCEIVVCSGKCSLVSSLSFFI
jgi:hypothetical protein